MQHTPGGRCSQTPRPPTQQAGRNKTGNKKKGGFYGD